MTQRPEPPPIGTTVPDLLLRLLRYPAAWITLALLALAFLGLVLSGMLVVSWEGTAIKVSRNAQGDPVLIEGAWQAKAQDLPNVIDNMREPYQYEMGVNIKQNGLRVTIDGTYKIIGHDEDPIRHITGTARLDGEYLSWTYETSINKDASVTHGVMLIKVQPSLRQAKGYYLGRSLKNDGGVFGSIELTRQPQ